MYMCEVGVPVDSSGVYFAGGGLPVAANGTVSSRTVSTVPFEVIPMGAEGSVASDAAVGSWM
jgi:hypothetical protein